MAIKKTSREEILKHSIKLFKLNGYSNTSMANIASECGLIKGSIYHHFKSKDEIGIESLKYIHKYFKDKVFNIAFESNLTNKQKIELFVKKTDEYFLSSQGGCLLGNIALELSSEKEAFRDEIRSYFTDWENALEYILREKYKNEAKSMAKEYIALIQGSVMMMNLYDTHEEYLKVGRKIINLL